MTFDIQKFTQVSVSTSSNQVMDRSLTSLLQFNIGAPNVFAYTSIEDYQQDILADGYFNDVAISLKVGDTVFVSCKDGTFSLEITFINYNYNTLVVETDLQGSSGWFGKTVYIPYTAVRNLNNEPYLLVKNRTDQLLSCVSCILSLQYDEGVVPIPYGNVNNTNLINVVYGIGNNTAQVDATGFLNQTNTDFSLATNGLPGLFTNGIINLGAVVGADLFLASQDEYINGNANLIASLLYTKSRTSKT